MTPSFLRPSLIALALIAVMAAVGACAPVQTLNALTPTDTYDATASVAYGSGPRRQLDVYQPRATKELKRPDSGWPLVVFFYGGSWNRGERGEYRFVAEALAARGIVVVVPDYRLYPEVRYPEFLHDSAAAVAWAMRNAERVGADPRRVFVMGHSAGGYNAAMIALDARWLKAEKLKPAQLAGWIGLAGPYDFLPIENPEVKPVFFFPTSPPDSQPIVYANAESPRTFLGAAPKDSLVNPERNTQQMAGKLKAAGVPVKLETYPNTGHETLIAAFARPFRFLAGVLDDVVAFVENAPPSEGK